MKLRGIGWCINRDCQQYLAPVFIMNIKEFKCEHCILEGSIELEEEVIINTHYGLFKEVQVLFHFNVREKKYSSIAIVRDETKEGGIFIFRSPLIKTETRALKIAEILLSRINYGERYFIEDTLSLDESRKVVYDNLQELSRKWKKLEEKFNGNN